VALRQTEGFVEVRDYGNEENTIQEASQTLIFIKFGKNIKFFPNYLETDTCCVIVV
jgi:hypothetical protein